MQWLVSLIKQRCYFFVRRTCFDQSCLHVADICRVQSTPADQQISATDNNVEACSNGSFVFLPWNPQLRNCLSGGSSRVQSYEVEFADGQAKLAWVLWRAT
ncbi:TPA: hypothetical protein ACH3X1_000771 [Trebouxia sp. C0004]